MKKTLFQLAALAVIILISSCETGPGEGGTSTIRGTVWVKEYNGDFTYNRGEYPGAKEDVYIIYGDEFVYGDRFETNYDGTYEFNYLREGTYTIFAYSKDTLNLLTDEEIPIMQTVEITAKDQTVEVPVITIVK